MSLDPTSTRFVQEIVPGRETVTLRVMTAEGAFAEYVVAGAKLNPSSLQMAGMNQYEEVYEGEWVFWKAELEAANVPSTSPKLNDQVVQTDGGTWAIKRVGRNLFGNEVSCPQSKKIKGA